MSGATEVAPALEHTRATTHRAPVTPTRPHITRLAPTTPTRPSTTSTNQHDDATNTGPPMPTRNAEHTDPHPQGEGPLDPPHGDRSA